ncbi:MAG: hypothetical protein NC417_11410 [Candidatus Gastranaerophilales bacterium]|nr:hypothetical protein [Candidatus Gastranaerophilales bacterium]
MTGTLILTLFLLSACAAPEDSGTADQGLETFLIMPEDSEMAEQEPEISFSIPEDGKMTEYEKVVEASREGTLFSLIDLDGDEIPELAAGDRGNDIYSIYTIKDGTVFCLADAINTVELTYFEGSGVIATFASWNGGGDEGGYGRQYYQTSTERTLTDEDAPLLAYSYNAVYDKDGNYTGKGITEYFYMEQTTDETSYREILETLKIVEADEKACLKDAVGAEEMLKILNADPDVLENLVGEYTYESDYGDGKLIIAKTSDGYDISDYESESSYRFLANSSNIETIENSRIYIKYPEQVFSDDTARFCYYILEYGANEINVYYGKTVPDEAQFLYCASRESDDDAKNK